MTFGLLRLHDDLGEAVQEGNWSTSAERTLHVADLEFEIMGDPQRIDDALILACAVTGSRH